MYIEQTDDFLTRFARRYTYIIFLTYKMVLISIVVLIFIANRFIYFSAYAISESIKTRQAKPIRLYYVCTCARTRFKLLYANLIHRVDTKCTKLYKNANKFMCKLR